MIWCHESNTPIVSYLSHRNTQLKIKVLTLRLMLLATFSISPWFGHYLLFSMLSFYKSCCFAPCFYISKLVMCFMWLLSALFLEGFYHFIHIMLIKVVLSETNKQKHPPKQQRIGWVSREELNSAVPSLFWVSYLEKLLWLHNILYLTVEDEIVFAL